MGASAVISKLAGQAADLYDQSYDAATASAATNGFEFFLHQQQPGVIEKNLDLFCRLDDYDIMATIKNWCTHSDHILSTLCRSLIDRRLYKVKLQAEPFDEAFVRGRLQDAVKRLGISEEEASYFVFTGIASNTTYDPSDESINILFKDGSIKDISQVDNALVSRNLSSTVKKHYICYLR